jgi:hypothetical protein
MKAAYMNKVGADGLIVDRLIVEEAAYPHLAENDVMVRVHAAGFTYTELHWPSTWSRPGRTGQNPGHSRPRGLRRGGRARPRDHRVDGGSASLRPHRLGP